MKENRGKISVCVATFNGEKYIREQMESILRQLAADDEVIVSDQNSTDNTVGILRKFNDPRIRIFSFDTSGLKRHKFSASHYMVTANFANALSHADGEYIFLSDQDDVWADGKIKLMLPFVIENKIVMSNYSEINCKNDIIKESHYSDNPVSNNFIKNIIKQPFHGCCMAFPRKLLQFSTPFPKNLIMHDNWIGLLGKALKYDFIFINVSLLYYRIHGNNVSRSKDKNPLYFKMYYRLILTFQIWKRLLKTRASNYALNH